VSDLHPNDFSMAEARAAHEQGCMSAKLCGLRHASIEHRRRNLWEERFKQRLNGDRLIRREGCERDCIHPDHQVRVPVVVDRR
jgi:hypothetical protein